jgi:hypothetical protein
MRIVRYGVAAAVLLLLLHPPSLQGQVDQASLAQQLRSASVAEQDRALAEVLALAPDEIGPELRVTLIAELEKVVRAHRAHRKARKLGQPLPPVEDPKFILPLSRAVAGLNEPRAIPALAGGLGTGGTVIRALVEFGDQSAAAISSVVRSVERSTPEVNDGLIALRFLIERAETHPVSPGTLEEIRSVAHEHLLRSPVSDRTGGTLRWAVDLAIVLGDPDLREIVALLATDETALIERGITDPDDISRTQARATDGLAGRLPLPRW